MRIDEIDDDLDNASYAELTPLTDGNVQRFRELRFPIEEQSKTGQFTGKVSAIDEEGIEVSPLDGQLQELLMLLCPRRRLERIQELAERPRACENEMR